MIKVLPMIITNQSTQHFLNGGSISKKDTEFINDVSPYIPNNWRKYHGLPTRRGKANKPYRAARRYSRRCYRKHKIKPILMDVNVFTFGGSIDAEKFLKNSFKLLRGYEKTDIS